MSHGTPNTVEFEKSIPKPGSVQWEKNHRLYEEQQELYRKRVIIPDIDETNVAVAAAYLDFAPKRMDAPASSSSDVPGMFFRPFIFLTLLILIGVLMFRQLAPQMLATLHQRFNPWAASLDIENDFAAKALSQEKAFEKYYAMFRVGPPPLMSNKSLDKKDQIAEFFVRVKKILVRQRKLLVEIMQEANGPARHKTLMNLHSDVTQIKLEAGIFGALPIWQMASSLEGLLGRLTGKMNSVSSSALRTFDDGLVLLDDLCQPHVRQNLLTHMPFRFLIVDDDFISRQALALSLEKALGKPHIAADGIFALAQIASHEFDVIFLDVQMPGMNGFELLSKIRRTVCNRTTPVVFVSSHGNFNALIRSTLSGDAEFIGKPFLIFEITVKALTLALQGRLKKQATQLLPGLNFGMAQQEAGFPRPEKNLPVAKSSNILQTPITSQMPSSRSELANGFLNRASKKIESLQKLCQALLRTSSQDARQSLLSEGFLRTSSLLAQNHYESAHPAYQMNLALEGLFKKLLQDLKYCTSSTLATLATGTDLLRELYARGMRTDLTANPPIHILIVDDDLIARRIILGALQTTFEKPESVESGEQALALLVKKTFDVIFLDVLMPGMDGFEVFKKIRNTIANRVTPIVFVTSLENFEVRAKISHNDSNDLMRKPFLASEIIVKAMVHALRGRLQRLAA